MKQFLFFLTLSALLLFFATPDFAYAQAVRVDTTKVYDLESVVVTADRSRSVLSASTASVSVLQTRELQRLPALGIKDALQSTPGFAFLNIDGLGYNPQATVRGFYGGGETEYVVVLLDGKPLNQAEQGLVDWNLVPLSRVKTVEVLRGGASALYGDAAIGSVINLVTDQSTQTTTQVGLQGGSFGMLDGTLQHSGTYQGRLYSIFGELRRLDGFRDHSERTEQRFGGSFDLLRTTGKTLTVSTLNAWRTFDDPGPLTEEELAVSRIQESPFFRFDQTDDRVNRISLDGSFLVGRNGLLGTTLTGDFRHADINRTLPLSAGFADTKNRVTDAQRLLGSTQYTVNQLPLSGKLTVGSDITLGRLNSTYSNVLVGPAEAYDLPEAPPTELDRDGTANRRAMAGFAQLDLQPAPIFKLSLGARADWIKDTYDPIVPADEGSSESTNSAFSPKVGINVQYMEGPKGSGRVYATVSRSFKAATLDQLYDQRTYPFSPDFPPITISNAELRPQTGTNIEAGLYQRLELTPDQLTAEWSLSVYQIDMKDELDFDFNTLRFVNIAESRHRGIETGLKLFVSDAVTVFANYTYQGVTAKTGQFEGNFVRAIPRDFISTGVHGVHPMGLGGSLKLNASRRIFLNDVNTVSLPDYTTLDARVLYQIGRLNLHVDVFNLLDEEYSSFGFPDPAGSDVFFLYPAAGRVLRAGLTVSI